MNRTIWRQTLKTKRKSRMPEVLQKRREKMLGHMGARSILSREAKLQWATKVLRHLVVKFDFWAFSSHFPPFPPKQCWFFYFFDCTGHSAYTTLNWGAGGIRELTLNANKVEKMLKYRKAWFPKSVSTTFVAHCLEAIYANCVDFLYISKL